MDYQQQLFGELLYLSDELVKAHEESQRHKQMHFSKAQRDQLIVKVQNKIRQLRASGAQPIIPKNNPPSQQRSIF